MTTHSLIGRGWSFPIRLDEQGQIALTRSDENEIIESIRTILGTIPGERVMRPTFGSYLHELVFAPLNPATAELARRYVEDALQMWEPRIRIEEIRVDLQHQDAQENHCLWIELDFEMKTTHDRRSLVYPFYLIPQE